MAVVTSYKVSYISQVVMSCSRRGLKTEKSSITGVVGSTGGSSCEELRDVGQQVCLPGAEGELRGGVGVDVVVIGHGHGQF